MMLANRFNYNLENMRKNAKTITSPNGVEFKRGQKVCSYGDETTYGFIDCWDKSEDCWRIKADKGGFYWWPEDEPTPTD